MIGAIEKSTASEFSGTGNKVIHAIAESYCVNSPPIPDFVAHGFKHDVPSQTAKSSGYIPKDK
jgi:hypothetical protein